MTNSNTTNNTATTTSQDRFARGCSKIGGNCGFIEEDDAQVCVTCSKLATRVINLTPHAINVGEKTYEASGMVARISVKSGRRIGTIDGTPVFDRDEVVSIENLPESTKGVYYIVSGMVGNMLDEERRERGDVLVPGTGPQDGAIRNEKGHIVAVTRLKSA